MGVYEILPIILFVIQLGLIGYYIYTAIKSQKFISKNTIFYFVPISIVLFVLYTLGANYKAEVTNTPLTVMDYLAICKAVIAATVFELKTDYLTHLMDACWSFRLAYILAVVLSIACVYTSVISLVFNTVLNKFRISKALSKNCDILIGENDYNLDYIRKSESNCIVITNNIKSERINEYYVNKIGVLQMNFNSKNLLKTFKSSLRKERELNFISFCDSTTNLGFIKEFEDFLNMPLKKEKVLDRKTCYLKVEIDLNNQMSLKNKILENKTLAAFIDCFNRYELFSLDFVEKNPITEHLPKDFILEDKGVVSSKKKINVVYLGFGKFSKTLHKAQLTNDQLPTINNDKLVRYKINYYAFDKDEKANEDKNMNFYFRRFDENVSKYNSKEYFAPSEKLDNLKFEVTNVESYKLINHLLDIIDIKKKEDSYNRFIISFGTDVDNIDMAIKIESILKEHNFENYEIYIHVRNQFPSAIRLLDNPKINVIGNISSIFNHDVIVNERLLELAKLVNRKYDQKRLADSSWYSLSPIKQASNIYSSLNIRLKLNLLGYDYIKENHIVDNEEIIDEISKKVKFEKKSYDDYLFYKNNKIEPVHSIAYQEHLRWNAFYISNGYVPLKIKDIKLLNPNGNYGPEFYKDDNSLKLHACLTTYEGLDEYHHHLAKLLSEANSREIEENINVVETYKYDHMIVENIRPMFKDSKYRIIKRG